MENDSAERPENEINYKFQDVLEGPKRFGTENSRLPNVSNVKPSG